MFLKFKNFEKLLIAGIIFYTGLVFCLPVFTTIEMSLTVTYPWWASRIVFGNILLNELLFILWILLFGKNFVFRALFKKTGIPTRQAAICLIILAFCCVLSSLYIDGSAILKDIGRTFRLLLLAFMLVAVVRWTQELHYRTLVIFLVGIVLGTVINLYISFENPFIVAGKMRLHGQNTPGVWMAVGIHLAAWLFVISSNSKIQILSVITLLITAFGVGLSFSRIGWLVGGLGIGLWIHILFFAATKHNLVTKKLRQIRFLWLPIFFVIAVISLSSTTVKENISLVNDLIQQKAWTNNDSNNYRKSYIIGTAEIVSNYPLGVGYSGFYKAMVNTEIYKSGLAAREESPTEANPHSSFLYYAATGGVLALFFAISLFLLLARITKISLHRIFGSTGLVFSISFIGSMFLIGCTVPYLFNSGIFFIPVSILSGLSLLKMN